MRVPTQKIENVDIYDFEDTDPDCLLQEGTIDTVASVTFEREEKGKSLQARIESTKFEKLFELLKVVAVAS